MSLLIHSQPLLVLPELAENIGLNEAIILQQIHYWQSRSQNQRDGRTWVYNSAVDWQQQFPFWSVNTIRRALAELRKQELVYTGRYNRDPRDKTLWYSVNYSHPALTPSEPPFTQNGQMEEPKMGNPSTQNGDMRQPKMGQPLPETTAETTTEPLLPPDGDKPKKTTEKKSTQLPEGFQPNDTHHRLAKESGVSLATEIDNFKDHHLAKGSKFKDWNRALNTWLRNAGKFNKRNNVHPFPQRPTSSTDDCGGKVYIPTPANGGGT